MSREKNTVIVKQIARDLGFLYCGISKSGFLEEEAPRLENWLKSNYHGKMAYMENYFDKRLDTTLLVPGSKSVISLILNYYPEKKQKNGIPKISKYAYGKDYHLVIKDLLKDFLHRIREEIGEVDGRFFVDSAPVLEKAWGKKAGLGWQGKNGNLITPKTGSFYFLAELIVDLDLNDDAPIKDYCGTCTKCIDACPTDALHIPYVVDGSKCISYLTIELKDELIPSDLSKKLDNWAFGCDICQDICPWNRFSTNTQIREFEMDEGLINLSKEEWMNLEDETFQVLAKNSPIKRTKLAGMKRNVLFFNPDAKLI